MNFDESSSERPGVLVEAADGRLFFLPNKDAEKFVIESGDHELLNQLMGVGRARLTEDRQSKGNPVISPMTKGGCRAMLRWLLANDPSSQEWRENSVIWMNNC